MNNLEKTQEKEIKADKKDIAKRLKLSSPKVWKALSSADQVAVVNKYYELRSIDHLGIDKILEDNRNIRGNMAFLLVGLLLGILGNIFASIFLKYEPRGVVSDVLNIIAFLGLLFYFVCQIDKWSADHLGWSDVLNHLLRMIKEDAESEKLR